MPLAAGTRLGPYQILAPIGRGGMGEVYRAADDRLGRSVAVKVLADEMSRDPGRRTRFEREARAIAALNHPHICAIFDIGVQDGLDFLVMELLEGESLAERLRRGALPPDEALHVGLTVLDTLAAVHERGLVHRDLKPGNIFLSRHGVKLLDFGLARSVSQAEGAETRLTQQGIVMGTPHYMSPEQIRGGLVDHRTDLFAAAAVIFEMLAGRAPFDAPSLVDVVHAVVYDEAPPLPAGLAPEHVDRTLRQALAKDPAQRPADAAAFGAALRGGPAPATRGTATSHDSHSTRAVEGLPAGRARTRLIVLPFKTLRADADTDFLGFSLPDAVSAAMAGLDSVVVRSSLTAAQFTGPAPDLRALASQAEVDAVVTGTILRAGGQVRVAAQLIAVPDGSLIWSHTIQAPVQDLFQLQDALTNAIVSALHLPLSAQDHRALKQDVPASATAYELFLRGNQMAADSSRWFEVRRLYEQAVELDPGYAPAWARLGRVLRVIAKYTGREGDIDRERAERAFERALALNPDLATAHYLYAHLEAESGRASDAMVRLLTRARARTAHPDLFAGLVATCRYCGLLDESIAAHEQAVRLDPTIRTSVAFAHYLRGDYDRTIATDTGNPPFASTLALMRRGDTREAIAEISRMEEATPHPGVRLISRTYRLSMTGDVEALLPHIDEMTASGFADPEGYFLLAAFVARSGGRDAAIATLERAVNGGFHCPSSMRDDPYWDPIRADPAFVRLLAHAEAGTARAREAFDRVGGAAIVRPTA